MGSCELEMPLFHSENAMQRMRGPKRTALTVLPAMSWVLLSCSDPSYGSSEDIGSDPSTRVRDAGADAASAVAMRQPDAEAGATAAAGAGGMLAPEAGAASDPPAAPDAGLQSQLDATLSQPAPVPAAPAVLAAWARPLLGRYAALSHSYKQDEYDTMTRAEELAYAEFIQTDAGALTLRTRLCSAIATTSLASLRLTNARAFPERTETVLLSETEQRWSTAGTTLVAGFTREAPPALCAGKLGQAVAASPEQQPWLRAGTCRCAAAGEEPLIDDCRVVDPDRDRKPGLTYELEGLGASLGNATVYAVAESDTHYVHGLVGADGARHSANVLPADKVYQLDCEPVGCGNLAKLGKYCAATINHASFVRLPAASAAADADPCDAILATWRTLFPEPLSVEPMRCFQ
jgi:hypothetical protein